MRRCSAQHFHSNNKPDWTDHPSGITYPIDTDAFRVLIFNYIALVFETYTQIDFNFYRTTSMLLPILCSIFHVLLFVH